MDGFQFKVNKSMTKKDIDRVTKIFFCTNSDFFAQKYPKRNLIKVKPIQLVKAFLPAK
jgi:hypothetical protein